jgi:UDPglucose 6-dehydrogenase/GDP-mannose 6-dehydrogenase
MNPEFLTERQAVQNFLHPDRIVLGALDARAMAVLDALYASFRTTPKIRTNTRTAEAIKYASNALLATMISFSNEIAALCAAIGDTDVVDVLEAVHASSYLSVDGEGGRRAKAPITSFLAAGCGYGGSCLPKDVGALVAQGRSLGLPMPLLAAVTAVNEAQPREVRRILERRFPTLAGLRIAVLGLAFKPDTDDVRQSPAFPIIRSLLEADARVTAYDPVAIPEARKVLPEGVVHYASTLADCLSDVDAAVIVTRWREFEAVPALLNANPRAPLLVDGRRLLDKRAVARYAGIGL